MEQHHPQHAPEHHLTPLWIYFVVFAGLIFFTLLTVGAAKIDLGDLNTPVALVIATCKAVLVILFFMHVINSPKLTWVVIISSLIWLGVLFSLTLADYLSRGWTIY